LLFALRGSDHALLGLVLLVHTHALLGLVFWCIGCVAMLMQGLFPDPRRSNASSSEQCLVDLRRCAFKTVSKAPRWSNFKFYFHPSMLMEGVVYGDGQHANQQSEIPQHMVLHSQWYPAIFSNRMEGVLLWVRCEPLILGDSRPWQTHVSRLRLFDGAGNPIPLLPRFQPPPPPYPPPTWNQPSSTVVIEEVEEPTALMVLPGCCRYSGCLAVMHEEVDLNWGWYCSLQCFINEGWKIEKARKTKTVSC